MKTILLIILFASCKPMKQPPEQKESGIDYLGRTRREYLNDTIGIYLTDTLKLK